MTDNKVAPLGQFDTTDKTLDEILRTWESRKCPNKIRRASLTDKEYESAGCFSYCDEMSYCDTCMLQLLTLAKQAGQSTTNPNVAEAIQTAFEKGKQAGRDEVLDLNPRAFSLARKAGITTKLEEKIAALEAEIIDLKKNPATLPANYNNYQEICAESKKHFEYWKAAVTANENLTIRNEEMEAENKRLNEGLRQSSDDFLDGENEKLVEENARLRETLSKILTNRINLEIEIGQPMCCCEDNEELAKKALEGRS